MLAVIADDANAPYLALTEQWSHMALWGMSILCPWHFWGVQALALHQVLLICVKMRNATVKLLRACSLYLFSGTWRLGMLRAAAWDVPLQWQLQVA